jgi:hypothetical protein
MNLDAVRPIADAVLYEGYLLYPYRASAVKNRSRWQFGVVMPAGYRRADPSEREFTQAQCLVEGEIDGPAAARLTVALRFLQVQTREVQRWTGRRFLPADVLEVDGAPVTAWDEAVEQEVVFRVPERQAGAGQPAAAHEHAFHVASSWRAEKVRDHRGRLVGRVVRRRRALRGAVTVAARPVPGPWRSAVWTVRVDNRTPLPRAAGRSAALPSALVACHTVLGVEGGSFVSMVDHPQWAAEAVAGCVNDGTWPVLAGPPGRRDLMLCAPIILYDHPRIAPESVGDLFDGTEIDELLTLRTLTLSDAEKRAARGTDPRAAALLDRTEALSPGELGRMHGAIRHLRPAPPDDAPGRETLLVAGERVRGGSRVRLRPGVRRTDAQDMFLAGRIAVVEAVLRDVDDNPYLAVTLADDPAADLNREHGRFRYFAPDEVEPLP